MALIDDFVRQVTDPALRAALALEVAELKRHVTWGLVFERHRPESTRLLVAPIKVGTVVWERRAIKPQRLRVRGIDGDQLIVAEEPRDTVALPDAATFHIARSDVLVEKPFTEAIYPALTSLGSVRKGPADRPSHVVVEAENYHAIDHRP
jgi:adenine-specific DNA-methyltransferase